MTRHAEVEFVHAIGEVFAEPALVVLDGKVDVGLPFDQLPDSGIGEQCPQLGFIIALDDKGIVEFRVANVHVLHPQPLAQSAEDPGAIDRKAESVLIDVGGSQSCVRGRRSRDIVLPPTDEVELCCVSV